MSALVGLFTTTSMPIQWNPRSLFWTALSGSVNVVTAIWRAGSPLLSLRTTASPSAGPAPPAVGEASGVACAKIEDVDPRSSTKAVRRERRKRNDVFRCFDITGRSSMRAINVPGDLSEQFRDAGKLRCGRNSDLA